MPKARQTIVDFRTDDERRIHPDHFYRLTEGTLYFGYAPMTLDLKIKSGEVPRPVSLSDSGRAKGWFGREILKWQAARQAKSDADAKQEAEDAAEDEAEA
jgi:predicted DNA-binding transcriptional regulator AlpA